MVCFLFGGDLVDGWQFLWWVQVYVFFGGVLVFDGVFVVSSYFGGFYCFEDVGFGFVFMCLCVCLFGFGGEVVECIIGVYFLFKIWFNIWMEFGKEFVNIYLVIDGVWVFWEGEIVEECFSFYFQCVCCVGVIVNGKYVILVYLWVVFDYVGVCDVFFFWFVCYVYLL